MTIRANDRRAGAERGGTAEGALARVIEAAQAIRLRETESVEAIKRVVDVAEATQDRLDSVERRAAEDEAALAEAREQIKHLAELIQKAQSVCETLKSEVVQREAAVASMTSRETKALQYAERMDSALKGVISSIDAELPVVGRAMGANTM